MVTVQLPDHVFQQLTAAAAARHMAFEDYLNDLTRRDESDRVGAVPFSIPTDTTVREVREARPNVITPSMQKQAADSIRALAKRISDKATIEELIADRHRDHRH